MPEQESLPETGASTRKATGSLKLPSSEVPRASIERATPPPPLARRDFTIRLAELLIQLAAIIGAIALGLGITAYFSQHRYLIAYLVAYGAFRFADLLVRDPATLGIDAVRFARRMIDELPLLALFFAAPFERTFMYGGEPARWLCGLGLLIELAGIWLALGARIQAGYFHPVAASGRVRPLIRNGLYRYIRFPIYAGELMVVFAWPFEYGAPISLLLAIAVGFIVTNRRIQREEADMMAEYGDDYANYVRITDRVIPNLW
jgi:protein-S-isoprenylcysteine O-methyltransferase Ste14